MQILIVRTLGRLKTLPGGACHSIGSNSCALAWQYHAAIQDEEALYLARLEQFGEQDIKTKNALDKFQRATQGEGAVSVVLMSRANGKEMSQEVYKRSVHNKNGQLHVTASNKVQAYKLCTQSCTLETLSDPPITRALRIVSVTGRSRGIQEFGRPNYVFACSKGLLQGGLDKPCRA